MIDIAGCMNQGDFLSGLSVKFEIYEETCFEIILPYAISTDI